MCGIFGYIGPSNNAGTIVGNGLKRLDYRGYDSWGIAVVVKNKVKIEKKAGKISDTQNFEVLPSSHTAIGHTRWATTGAVSDINAHPHLSTDKSFALAQNGIMENYSDLKTKLLKKGYKFYSQTDTEVIVRLIEEKNKNCKNLLKAIRSAFLKLEGRNTIILVTSNNQIIAVKKGSPLIVGINPKSGETFLSSDTLSLAGLATKMSVIGNGQMVQINKKNTLYDIISGRPIPWKFDKITFENNPADKGVYEHYMLKEIFEAPKVLRQLIGQSKQKYESLAVAVRKAKNIYTIGSGGAGVAAAQVAFYLRDIVKINATSLIGSDSMEYSNIFTKDDLVIAISQSGETADVLEVLDIAKEKGVRLASFVNMPGSVISRMSDYPFMSESGPEICVMSTKTFDAQIAFGYLLAKVVKGQGEDARVKLKKLSEQIEKYLNNKNNLLLLKKIAKKLSGKHDIFLLGKYQNFQIIREGMVKIIEATYKHGHALPSGDLKHYVITLMEKGVPVIALISNDAAKKDVLNAVDEVHLRGAQVIGISPNNYENFDEYVPVPDMVETSAIMNLIPLQLIAYYIAIHLNNNVDKPRNIAKSVTVK